MKKVVFKNQLYYYSLIVIIIVLVGLNIVQILEGNWIMLIPIIVQIVLLFLILSKNHYSKIAIKIWLIILLVTGAIQFFLGVFYLIAGEAKVSNLLFRIAFIALEILLLVNLKSIEIIDEELS